ncbi:MAG: hypothetical protein Q8R70_08860 [Methanoregula sp.]|nr:hypothetical protein [Methanoregula sp.]
MKIVFGDDPPLQDLSLGTAGQEGFLHFSFKSLNRRGGAPSGAAAFIVSGGMGVSTPIIIPEECDFHGKSCFGNSLNFSQKE